MANRTDNCNRTAAPPGTPSDGGSAWVVGSGTWGCGFDAGSGRTVLYSTTAGAAWLDCGVTDHSIEALLVRNDSGTGLIARVADGSNYYLFHVGIGGTLSLFKNVSGSFTAIGSGSGSASLGDTLFLSVVGNSLVGKVNGVTLWTATDSALTTGTKAGGYVSTGGFGFFDDVNIVDLAGGGGVVGAVAILRHVAGLGG